MRPPRPKSSQHYLRERQRREKERDHGLKSAIEQSGREILYKHLYRMGEANEWAVELGLPTRYRAFKGKDGSIKCHIYEGGQFEKEVSLELFEKRYSSLKSRWNQVTGFKEKEEKEKPATEPVHALSREEQERRQSEIRAALLNTIHLTQTLKEQLKVLDKRAPGLTPFIIE